MTRSYDDMLNGIISGELSIDEAAEELLEKGATASLPKEQIGTELNTPESDELPKVGDEVIMPNSTLGDGERVKFGTEADQPTNDFEDTKNRSVVAGFPQRVKEKFLRKTGQLTEVGEGLPPSQQQPVAQQQQQTGQQQQQQTVPGSEVDGNNQSPNPEGDEEENGIMVGGLIDQIVSKILQNVEMGAEFEPQLFQGAVEGLPQEVDLGSALASLYPDYFKIGSETGFLKRVK